MNNEKQIIIDGVDVKNCNFFLSSNKYCGLYSTGCRFVPDCYYKQLARKTKECEQKEKELKELKELKCQYKLSCLDCEYKNTKVDVERYRKECDFWKHQAELGSETTDRLAKQLEEKEQECEELKEKYEEVKEDRYNLNMEMYVLDHYRKALEEIEEIAKSFNKNELCFYKEINECDCCDMGADCNYLRRAKILYIINKAKGEGDE